MLNKRSCFVIDGTEINHLQDRLASTEAQMCKILTALDAASDKVNKLTKKPAKVATEEEPVDRSSSDSDASDNDLPSNDPVHDSSAEEDEEFEAQDPTPIDDEEEQYQRDRSLSDSSQQSSNDDDQSAPNDELNRLIRRKRQ